MFKNVASQKLTVRAFATAGHASLDPGEPVTGDAAQITCKVEQDDDGTQSAVGDTNPAEIEDGLYVFDVTAGEVNGDKLTFFPDSSTAGVVVVALPSNVIYTRPVNFPALGIESDGDVTKVNLVALTTDVTTKTGYALSATGLDLILVTATFVASLIAGVWDRVLSGATHNINQSSGKRLRAVAGTILAEGTAQAGGDNTITLAAGESAVDQFHRRSRCIIVGGLGAGQERIASNYDGTGKVLTITPAWTTNPDNTSEYEIVPGQVHTSTQNGGYNGQVFVDTVNGTTGQLIGVNGISSKPCKNMVDAFAIAAVEGFNTFCIAPGSTITLPSSAAFKSFEGHKYQVLLNGVDINGTTFSGAVSITGVGLGGALTSTPNFFDCALGDVTLPPCSGLTVGFFGTLTMASVGLYVFGNSGTFGPPGTFDFGAGLNASTLLLPNWAGGDVVVQNMGQGTGTYKADINGNGTLTVEASCVAQTLVTGAGIKLTDNGSNTTLDDDGNYTGTLHLVRDAASLETYNGPTRVEATADKDAIITQGDSAWATATGFGDATEAKQDTLLAAQANQALEATLVAGIATVLSSIGNLQDLSSAQVATVIETALATTSRVEPTAPPADDAALTVKVSWLLAVLRNLTTNDGTNQKLFASDGTTVIGTAPVSDAGGLTSKGLYV